MRFLSIISGCIVLCLLSVSVLAQTNSRPILEREISLNCNNEPLPDILGKISKQADFNFSYPSELVDSKKLITINVSHKTVREVLNQLFNGKMSYKAKSNYLILSANSKEPDDSNKPSFILIQGYVTDNKTGEKIPSVSIFNKAQLVSTVTNTYGYFNIKLKTTSSEFQLNIRKENYRDTLIVFKSKANESISVSIQPLFSPDSISGKDSSNIEQMPVVDLLIPVESGINTENINDTLYEKVQISFLPILGTNERLSGNVINDYSFNILGGYSRGTQKAELGGLFNIDREDVQYAQLSGFLNAVGGNVKGAQLAGFLNLDRKKMEGVQIAGFGNIVWDDIHAVQLAGFFNLNRKKSKSIQIAGYLNSNLDTTSGIQIAGFLNSNIKTFDGFQLAGFLNSDVQKVDGVQVAGFLNSAIDGIDGVQVAGFFNYASKVNGSQIGFLNYSDTIIGVPVGFLSIVRKGYHKIEVSADELFYTNVAFRSGVRSFHNILFAGISPGDFNEPLWHFGYGLGSSVKLGKGVLMDFDLTSQHVSKGALTPKINLINKLTVDVDVKLSKSVSVVTGPVLNALLTDKNYTEYPDIFSQNQPNIFYTEKSNDNYNLQMWLGWKLGFRFL